MLALPILAGLSGFFPSLFLFFISWIFMTFTALLLVEVNGWFKGQINIVSMAEKAIGPVGKVGSWILYLFLFYSLLVAYISGTGSIFSEFLTEVLGQKISNAHISIFFTLLLGSVVYFGTRPVDVFNRFLMAGLVICYFGMILSGIEWVHPDYLLHVNWKYTLLPLPVLITSFGFHNMIPSLTAYLKGDLKLMRITILGGSFFVLIIYLIWDYLVVGIVPFQGEEGLLDTYHKGQEAAHALNIRLVNSSLGLFAQGFAFFAVVTSFIAQSLGLMHFIADGLKVKPTRKHCTWLILLTLLPPLLFALIYPTIFYQALGFAGGICAILLFGLLPALMAWIGRYKKKISSSYHVKGGKISLILVIIFSLFILIQQILKIFSVRTL